MRAPYRILPLEAEEARATRAEWGGDLVLALLFVALGALGVAVGVVGNGRTVEPALGVLLLVTGLRHVARAAWLAWRGHAPCSRVRVYKTRRPP